MYVVSTMYYVLGILVVLASARAVSIPVSHDRWDGPVCRPSTRCNATGHGIEGFLYSVNGHAVILNYVDGKLFSLWCDSNSRGALLLADDSEMPAYSQPVTVEEAVFNQCVIPQGTYYEALKAFNVTVSKRLLLRLPAEPQLEGHHLRDLQITHLEISAVDSLKPPRPSFEFLDQVPRLRTLKLTDTVLKPDALIRLPVSLEILNIVNAGLPTAELILNSTSNSSRWLERLRSLRTFYLAESSASLAQSPGAVLTPPQLSSLRYLTIVVLNNVPLDPRPENGLSSWLSGSALKELRLQSCGLKELPSSMFEGANLTKVILTYNNLSSFPNGVFSPLQWLRELDLSNNRLDGAALAHAVAPLARLETLKANYNPLGSLCGAATNTVIRLYSNLPKSLRRLELRNTRATRMCYDWILNNELMHIDLSNNEIGDLTYSELEMKRNLRRTAGAPVLLNLSNNLLRVIEVLPSNVKQCLDDASSKPHDTDVLTRVPVKIELTALACDCGAYWLREILRECPLLELEEDVQCDPAAPAPVQATLLAHGPDQIVCPYDGYCLPECSCAKRPRDNATVVRCAGTLPRMPRWPATARDYPLALHVAPGTLDHVPHLTLVEIHAPNNKITKLDKEDISDTLQILDVRNNTISHISLAAAQILGGKRAKGGNRSVLLAGNRLTCSCGEASAFSILKRVVHDWDITQCADQTYVSTKTKNELCASFLLPIVFGIAVPILMLVVAGLVLQRLLPHVKQFLFKRNLCLRWILSANDNVNDTDKTHDVFLSYAYDDLDKLNELKSGLEKLGYSTIEHCRDWQPGDAVMEQIARSVLCARRTLLLVSDNYAKSKWALEEFHAAHAHAMERRTARVLIVRCGLNKPETLPPDLQLYLYNNTYLAWDDPKFWHKICRVMPPLRQEHISVLPVACDILEQPSPILQEDKKKTDPFSQIIPLELVGKLAIDENTETVPCTC